MMGVIILNGFVLTCLHADQPRWLDETRSSAWWVLYCAEVVILMTAMTPPVYLEDPWNRFDVAIVIAGVIELSVPGDAPWIAVLRTFRIMRLFKIVKGMKELRILMYTIISALPGVSNIGVLLFLLMFSACLGVTLYRTSTRRSGSTTSTPSAWPNAMFTLFVVFTGNWESIFRARTGVRGDAEDWGRDSHHRYSARVPSSPTTSSQLRFGQFVREHHLDKFTAGDPRIQIRARIWWRLCRSRTCSTCSAR